MACGAGIGLGQDGDYQLGVSWPNPRFTKNGDGTVADNLTGLIWLEDADCFGEKVWADALAAANGLFDGSTNDPGSGDCGLSDNSGAGAWRLPNVKELQSLVSFGIWGPAVPNTAGTGQWVEGDPFSNVGSTNSYWSSNSYAPIPVHKWKMTIHNGTTSATQSNSDFVHVWPVRGGQ